MPSFLPGWTELILAIVLFVASHVIPAYPAVRQGLVHHMGKTGYLTAYSALSILMFIWLIVAAGRAPYLALWQFAAWQVWIPNITMPFVCVLLAYGIAAPNPFSIASFSNKAYDPERPGIVGCTRHPVLWAATLWALAHAVPNGDLAHVIVFCMFGALGVFGALIVEARKRRALGVDHWRRLSIHTSFVPLVALLSGRWHPSLHNLNFFRLVAAVGLYAGFVVLHRPIIGVSPFPTP